MSITTSNGADRGAPDRGAGRVRRRRRREVSRDAEFAALDVDSLDLVEMAQIVEEEWGVEIKGEDMKELKTFGDAIDLVVARLS